MNGFTSKLLTQGLYNNSSDKTALSSSLKSSLISAESPNNISGQHGSSFQTNFMFDLNQTDMTDLASDLNEFNDFFKNKSSQLKQIERPQNPFHKNF